MNLGPRASTVDFLATPPNSKLIPPVATVAATTGNFDGVGRREDYAIGTGVTLNNIHLRPSEGVVFSWESDAIIG